MFTIKPENLRKDHQLIWFIVDFAMLGLLILNLGLIIFDVIYSFPTVQELIGTHAGWLKDRYDPIHDNFLFYDLIFVSIFLTEFFIRWAYAIKAHIYTRWYFYPFIHWYDLVGCIPVGSLRFLRILRIISIIYRLQKYNVIDLTATSAYRFIAFYYDAFLEELSDRIVVKVLSGIQSEVLSGSPLFERIQHDILYPRRAMIADWISARVAEATEETYVPRRGALRTYLEDRVDVALKQNVELSRLRFLPVVGPTIQETLEEAVGDIVATVIHQLLDDLASTRNHGFIEDIVNAFLPEREPEGEYIQNEALINLINEVLEVIKGQVHVKRWRTALNDAKPPQ
ncbi:MAG: ion transporter [Oleiphilaceae bacterium]|nr:ion transporter [Oleiphilaceae bacterium]